MCFERTRKMEYLNDLIVKTSSASVQRKDKSKMHGAMLTPTAAVRGIAFVLESAEAGGRMNCTAQSLITRIRRTE